MDGQSPIRLLHDASQAIFTTAAKTRGLSGHEADEAAHVIALLERCIGNVPAFIDSQAEGWFNSAAAAVLRPGVFKATVAKLKGEMLWGDDCPPGVRLVAVSCGHAISEGNSADARRQLLALAKACTGQEVVSNFHILETRIERAVRAERRAVA